MGAVKFLIKCLILWIQNLSVGGLRRRLSRGCCLGFVNRIPHLDPTGGPHYCFAVTLEEKNARHAAPELLRLTVLPNKPDLNPGIGLW